MRNVDGSLRYQVSAHGLEEITAGHIHLGAPDQNGPVVATLFSFAEPDATAARTHDGLLASGTVSDDDVSSIESADDPSGEGFDGSLTSLIARVDAGEAYVNVHTVANPSGAIRGQITAIEGTEAMGGWFTDDDGNLHETNIDVIASPNLGITVGCTDDEYCPDDTVTRGQIASFLYRAMNLPDASSDHFSDDGDSVHEAAINAAAEAGVLAGVGDGRYAPERELSRAQYASLLANALGLDDMGANWPQELKQAADHVSGLGTVLGGAIDDQFGLEGDATSGTEGELNAADVRTLLTDLAVEHTLLTGVTTGAALRGETEVFGSGAAALEANTVEFGAAVGAFYGDAAEEAFLGLWREHIGYFVDYTNGVAADDGSQKETALENLRGYQQDIGALFEGATEGRVTQADIALAFAGHVDSLTAVIQAQGRAAVAPPADAFDDDQGSIHEASIDLIADAGITLGCTSGTYCPDEPISRAQMASLLVRALVWNGPSA